MTIKEIIDEMERLLTLGYSQKEIWEIKKITFKEQNEALLKLNNPAYEVYEPNRYEKLNAMKIRNDRKSWNQNSLINSKKQESVVALINGKMTLPKAAANASMSVIAFLLYMSQSNKEEVKLFLDKYGFVEEVDSNKHLNRFSEKTQKEIVLMALTYRVSFKTIAKMFDTNVLDVARTFLSFGMPPKSIDYLFLETFNEDESSEKMALYDAKKYWHARSVLVKNLSEALKKKNKEQEIQIKAQWKELQKEIDDTKVLEVAKKEAFALTEEERDSIARYLLKYYFSSKECGNKLGYDTVSIQRWSEDLANRNMVYEFKLDLHHFVYQEMYLNYVQDNRTSISRGGGSK